MRAASQSKFDLAPYDPIVFPSHFGPWPMLTVQFASPRRGERVLDIGCAGGALTCLLAHAVGPTGLAIGLDRSRLRLEQASAAAADVPTDIRPTWVEGDITVLTPKEDEQLSGLSGAAFDLAICQQILQFLPSPESALQAVRDRLRPGGRLALTVWTPIDCSPAYAALAAAAERWGCASFAEELRSPFLLGDPAHLQLLLGAAGFRITDVDRQAASIRFPSAEDWVRRRVSVWAGTSVAAEEAIRERLIVDATTRLAQHVEDRGVALAMESLFVLAQC